MRLRPSAARGQVFDDEKIKSFLTDGRGRGTDIHLAFADGKTANGAFSRDPAGRQRTGISTLTRRL